MTAYIVTDNGTHAADSWAIATTGELLSALKVNADSGNASKLEYAKERIKPKLVALLEKHYSAIQNYEREKLTADSARLLERYNFDEVVEFEATVDDVFELTKPLIENAAIFRADAIDKNHDHIVSHWKTIVAQRLEMDFRSTMHVERKWHTDLNPDHEHSKAFLERHAEIAGL